MRSPIEGRMRALRVAVLVVPLVLVTVAAHALGDAARMPGPVAWAAVTMALLPFAVAITGSRIGRLSAMAYLLGGQFLGHAVLTVTTAAVTPTGHSMNDHAMGHSAGATMASTPVAGVSPMPSLLPDARMSWWHLGAAAVLTLLVLRLEQVVWRVASWFSPIRTGRRPRPTALVLTNPYQGIRRPAVQRTVYAGRAPPIPA